MATSNYIWRARRSEPTLLDGSVAVCIDQSQLSRNVLAHALAVAGPLDAPITMVHVLEAGRASQRHPDPLEWELLRREARETLGQLAESSEAAGHRINTELVEGQAAEQICRWARDHMASLVVLGTHGESGPNERHLGATARDVTDAIPASVLLVPPTAVDGTSVRYRRILVPVDGSAAAESVLPVAIRIAAAHHAELVIAHVAPIPELTEIGPAEAEDLDLRERLASRNERIAKQYLDRLKARVALHGVDVRALVLRGDARSRLALLVTEEHVDMVLLSAQGRSNRDDVPCGSVATYLMTHVASPILVVRPHDLSSARRVPQALTQSDVRFPNRANW